MEFKGTKMLSYERLTQVLSYNELTGVFIWKETLGRRVKKGMSAGWFDKSTGKSLVWEKLRINI